jgi:ubiquitin-protein ligase
MENNFSFSSKILNIIHKQKINLEKNPPDGINFLYKEDEIYEISAEISGPEKTPYENGVFKIMLYFPFDFPNKPPKGNYIFFFLNFFS